MGVGMKRLTSMLALILALLTALAGEGLAQLRLLPASEYDRIAVRIPQAVSRNLEAMQRSNDFERLAKFRAKNRYRKIARPVGMLKLLLQDQTGKTGTSLCTASIVSRDFILTNNHCVPGPVGYRILLAKIQMEYLDSKNTRSVRVYAVDPKPVETDEFLDYTILRVSGNPGAVYGTVKISAQAPEKREAIFIVHHPEGLPQILSRKDCFIDRLEGREFVHSCDTLGGSSGSPIFSDNTSEMIGLHYAGGRDGNFGKSIAAILERSQVFCRDEEAIGVVASLSGPRRCVPVRAATTKTATGAKPRPVPPPPARQDAEAWKMVKTSEDIDLLREFMREFPDSRYVRLARFRIKVLQKGKANKLAAQDQERRRREARERQRLADERRRRIEEERGLADDGSLYTVQVFSTRTQKTAKDLAIRLKNKGFPAYVSRFQSSRNEVRYRVRVGKTTKARALELSDRLKREGGIRKAQLTKL